MFSHRYMNCTDLILIIFRPSPEFEDCSIIEIAISLNQLSAEPIHLRAAKRVHGVSPKVIVETIGGRKTQAWGVRGSKSATGILDAA
jgi:hypothetical protein